VEQKKFWVGPTLFSFFWVLGSWVNPTKPATLSTIEYSGSPMFIRLVRLVYQPPANSTFPSEQISHQQPDCSTFLSEQISTSHQPNEQADRFHFCYCGAKV
jgi:hypothetical protein